MKRFVWFAIAVCGCSTSNVVTSNVVTSDTCTLSTPLQPGVPGSPGHRIVSDLHPEGASELATVMRGFVADLRVARADLEAGKAVGPMYSRHAHMRCAWPTEVSDRDARFDALAQGYLTRVQALERTNSRAAFNDTLSACLACHENMCPGPIELIEQLKLPANSHD